MGLVFLVLLFCRGAVATENATLHFPLLSQRLSGFSLRLNGKPFPSSGPWRLWILSSLFEGMSDLKKLPPAVLNALVEVDVNMDFHLRDAFYLDVSTQVELVWGDSRFSYPWATESFYVYSLPETVWSSTQWRLPDFKASAFESLFSATGEILDGALGEYLRSPLEHEPHFDVLGREGTRVALFSVWLVHLAEMQLRSHFFGKGFLADLKLSSGWMSSVLNLQAPWVAPFFGSEKDRIVEDMALWSPEVKQRLVAAEERLRKEQESNSCQSLMISR